MGRKVALLMGMSGNAIRPIALRDVTAIANNHDNKYPILATGGCDSAHTALQFILAGAHAVQVCSAVQNQDSTVISDYTSGLRALMYLQTRKDLADWNGQYYRKTPAHQAGKPVIGDPNLPNFGSFAEQKADQIADHFENVEIVSDEL